MRSNVGRAIALAAVVAALVVLPSSAAAAPDHALTLTAGNSPQQWQGAFAALGTNQQYSPDESPELCPDEPSALDGSDFCDTALIQVDIDPSFWAENPGSVRIGIGDYDVPTSDFDLYVYESDSSGARGALVASGTSGLGAEEQVHIPNASGYYLVHVVYWAAAASAYAGTAAVVTGDGPPAGEDLPETQFFFHDDGGDPTDGTFDTEEPTAEDPTVAPGGPGQLNPVPATWTGTIEEGRITTLKVDFWQNAPVGEALLSNAVYRVTLRVGGESFVFPQFREAAPLSTSPNRITHVFTEDDPDSPLPIEIVSPGEEASIEIVGWFIDTQAVTVIYYDSTATPSGFSVNAPKPAKQLVPPDVDNPPGLQEVLASDPALGFRSHSEPHIAQNPRDPNMLVAGSKMYNLDPDSLPEYEFKIGTYASFDGGQSWADLGQLAVCPPEQAGSDTWPHNSCYPDEDPDRDGTGAEDGDRGGGEDFGEEYIVSDSWVQFDDEGNAYAMVLDAPPFESGVGWGMTMHKWESPSPEDVKSGETWSDRIPINLYDEPLTRDTLSLLDDKNTFAVNNAGDAGDGETGTIVACWGQTVGALIKQQIVCERSTDGGESWPGEPSPISDVQQLVIGVHVVADTQDPETFYATWLQYATGGAAGDIGGALTPETLEFAVSHDGGQTWVHRPLPASLVTGIPRQFPGQQFRNLSIPIMAVGPESELYIAWADYVEASDPMSDEDGMEADIKLVKSADGGATWGAAVPVNDTEEGLNPNADQFQPYVTVTESGQVNVAYFDRRLDPGNFFTDVFLARSNDGGETFTEHRLTHDATNPELNAPIDGGGRAFFGDYQGLVADECWAIPFFNDTHLANDDLDPGPGPPRDPRFDHRVPSSPFQEVVSWRVPNTAEFGGTRGEACKSPKSKPPRGRQ